MNQNDSITFSRSGSICTSGEHIRLIKSVYIRQDGNKLKFEQIKLETIRSKGANMTDYEFHETNTFPGTIEFETSAGYTPLFESSTNSNGTDLQRTSKYDSSGVFN